MEQDGVPNRRAASERRDGGEGHDGERRGAKKTTSPMLYVVRSLGAVTILVLVIVYAFVNTRPIYTTSGTLGEALRSRAPEVARVLSPRDSAHSDHVNQLMATPQFQGEKRNFYEDVMRLKQVDSARADSIAEYAVREAYVRGISPAIVFGVMLTENSRFISKAKSSVGAVGLMQIYPKVWLNKQMTSIFGSDLESDSTNVKYGVFILSHYFRPKKKGKVQEVAWQRALLRYNGCVRGTNTPRCHTYPSKVQKFVEGSATSICSGRSFYECIARPFVAGLFGTTNGTMSAQTLPPPKSGPAPPPAAPKPVTTPPASSPAKPAKPAKSSATASAKAKPAASRRSVKPAPKKKRVQPPPKRTVTKRPVVRKAVRP